MVFKLVFVVMLSAAAYVVWFVYKALDECDPHGPPSAYI